MPSWMATENDNMPERAYWTQTIHPFRNAVLPIGVYGGARKDSTRKWLSSNDGELTWAILTDHLLTWETLTCLWTQVSILETTWKESVEYCKQGTMYVLGEAENKAKKNEMSFLDICIYLEGPTTHHVSSLPRALCDVDNTCHSIDGMLMHVKDCLQT